MLERKSIVDQIEITRVNTVQVRLALLIVDGSVEISSRWHRTSIDVAGAAEQQMLTVQDHLQSMGEALVSQADIDRVVTICNVVFAL